VGYESPDQMLLRSRFRGLYPHTDCINLVI
jgi:hypothetical protein